MKSDYLYLDVRESLIPNSGLGVFAKTDLKAGQFIVEYRGYIISSKLCWAPQFMLEDKMVQINEKYSVIGRGLASRINDIIIFDGLNDQQIRMIQQEQRFPNHPGKNYNIYLDCIEDKAFLRALTDIKAGDELHFSYSYEYWKSFYDQRAEMNNFNEFYKKWDQYKKQDLSPKDYICKSDYLKISIQDGKVYAKEKIKYNEIILECRGKYYQEQIQSERKSIFANNLYLYLNKLSNTFFSYFAPSNEKINAETTFNYGKYFIKATRTIQQGEIIYVQ